MEKAFESVWLDGLMFKLNHMKFNIDVIFILINMLYKREFVTTDGNETSSFTFKIYNGLQQGTITAPILFNLYTRDLIVNSRINNNFISTIAYADDIIIYSSDIKIENIRLHLQKAITFITDYLHTWKIKINGNKCESILFRKPVQLATYDTKKNKDKLFINIGTTTIPQKSIVKYLGVNIDQFCYMNQHINLQIARARQAIISYNKIFRSKWLNSQVKIICYKSLIRPIITYGCPIWYNCSASYMERLRIFERKCIRLCTGKYRKLNTENRHYISNKNQYEDFKSERIDLYIIRLTRNHIFRTTTNNNSSYSYGPYRTDERLLQKSTLIGNLPEPASFIYLDKKGYIQNTAQIPIIYHINRRPTEKYFHRLKFRNFEENQRFSTEFIKLDNTKFTTQRSKYWWLNDGGGS